MSNKDSTIELDAPDNVFNRIYVYFIAIRMEFVTGCRPVIGLNRYF